jgi:hypothetical protein
MIQIKSGDRVTIEGERKPTEIKAQSIAVGTDPPVRLRADND